MFDWQEEYDKMYEVSGNMWSNEQCLQLQLSLIKYQELRCPNGENIGG